MARKSCESQQPLTFADLCDIKYPFLKISPFSLENTQGLAHSRSATSSFIKQALPELNDLDLNNDTLIKQTIFNDDNPNFSMFSTARGCEYHLDKQSSCCTCSWCNII